MPVYTADRHEEYGVTNWKIVEAAVLSGTTICLHAPKKFHEIFQKILPVTGPKCEPGPSLVESISHVKLTTMFNGSSIRA
jgi:hypothetical protein